MQYRELGNTGLKISSLGFGASSLGSVFHDTKEKESIKAVETAISSMSAHITEVSKLKPFWEKP